MKNLKLMRNAKSLQITIREMGVHRRMRPKNAAKPAKMTLKGSVIITLHLVELSISWSARLL